MNDQSIHGVRRWSGIAKKSFFGFLLLHAGFWKCHMSAWARRFVQFGSVATASCISSHVVFNPFAFVATIFAFDDRLSSPSNNSEPHICVAKPSCRFVLALFRGLVWLQNQPYRASLRPRVRFFCIAYLLVDVGLCWKFGHEKFWGQSSWHHHESLVASFCKCHIYHDGSLFYACQTGDPCSSSCCPSFISPQALWIRVSCCLSEGDKAKKATCSIVVGMAAPIVVHCHICQLVLSIIGVYSARKKYIGNKKQL